MTTALDGNLDYILFVYGLGFVLLAIAILGLGATVASPLPWKWFAVSVLFLGLSIWTDMFAMAIAERLAEEVPHTAADMLRTVLFVLGCAFLVEFARICWAAAGGRRVGRWIIVVLLALAASGSLAGPRGLDATAAGLLGLTGGLWAAAGIWRYQRVGGRHGRPLRLTAVALALFVVVQSILAFQTLWLNAEWMERESSFATGSLPVQLLCMAIAVPFVTGLWMYYRALLREEHPGFADRHGAVNAIAALAALALILAAGFYFTSFAGDRWDALTRASLLDHAVLAAAATDPDRVAAQTATPADVGTEDYRLLRQQLTLMVNRSTEVRWYYLMALKGDHIVFTVDGAPDGSLEHTGPGVVYEDPPPGLIDVFSGEELTIGPYSDEFGTYVSSFAPIRARWDGPVVGVMGIDADAADWVHQLALARTTPILVTLLLCLMVSAAYVALERSRLAALTIGESEWDYRTVLETMQDGFYRADDQGDLLMVSPSFAHIFGYADAAHVVGRNLANDFYQRPEDRVTFLEELAASGGQSAESEQAFKRADGQPICVSANAHYYRDAAGTVRGVEGVLRDITERKHAEMALAESEERSRLLLQSAGDGIVGVDRQGRVTFMNHAAEVTLGWAAAELTGQGLHNAIHYAHADGSPYPVAECPQRAAYAEGVESRVEDEVFWRKDGTAFPMEYISRPLRHYGRLEGAIVTFRDITERKDAEAALRESREHLAFVLRSAEVGIWDWDIASDTTTWDETVVALYGMTPGVLQGPWDASNPNIHPEDLEALRVAIDNCLQTGAPYDVDFRVVREDGAVAYIAERGRVTRDAKGRPVRMSGVTWDITGRRELEEIPAERHRPSGGGEP